MASRTEQLHSHQFARQRLIGALARHDPEPSGSPRPRLGGPLLAGVVLAVLGVAAAAVYGVLRPGTSDAWRDGGSVIVERETGARFVFRDGVLHPVLNYSSALLVLGSARPATVLVARSALAGVTRGTPIGIPGAPDLLPTPADLVTAGWSVCSRPGPSDAAVSTVESVLFVGSAPPSDPRPFAGGALLATDPAGGLHLLWNEHRFAIRDPAVVLTALGWSGQRPTPVAAAVLNLAAAGPDLSRLAVPRRGTASAQPGLKVGQVVMAENQGGGTRQYAVALTDGLADITPVQADLLLADPLSTQDSATGLSPATFAAAVRAPSLAPEGDAAPPPATPALVHPPTTGAVCATFADGGTPPRLGLVPALPRSADEITVPREDPTRVAIDRVVVPPGRGAVVEALPSPAAPQGALVLVGDAGRAYPVPSPDVLVTLGFAGVRPQRLPAALVALLPSGHPLDPAAARLPAPT